MKGNCSDFSLFTVLLLVLIFFLALPQIVSAAPAVFLGQPEGFENGVDDWDVDNSVWEVGVPTAGPESAHAGENCLATVLDGNYPRYADSRAISPAFVVPSVGESPRLRFWHWFSIYGSSDKGSVELREVGSDAWVQISPDYNNSSGVWTYASLDLRAYAGKSVQIAFHFQDDGTDTGYQHYTPTLRTGWYIDEVTVMTGATALPLNTDEGFEGGLGAWEPERGVWEVGVPTAGPESAHAGENCLATVLDGNYPRYADSRAISPAFVVPSVGESPRLRFWHWFSIYGSSDKGSVELREVGSDAWVQISPDYNNSSGVWTYASLDLRAYAGKSVQIAFHFQDDGTDTGYQHYTPTLRTGWYIDEVTVMTGATALPLNTDEGFEGGLGAWEPERGVWEVGVPTAGPESAHAGENCLATVLDGNYPRYADSRAISPAFVVPSVGESPRLRFWHWFSIYGSSDKGSVELREVGSDAWVQISPDYNNSSGVWTYASLDLRAYAGKSVQIAFHFQDDGTDTGYQHYTPTLRTGWYIDEVTVVTGATALPLNTDEGFEGGLGAWEPERGVWEVGVPTAGPESAHAGENCLATVLDGNYPRYADSRAISPAFVVPSVGESPRLRFWHWFSIYGSSDKGSVELREVGSDAWVQISPDYNNSSGVWTYASLDLRAYAGKSVQIAFHFQDDGTDTGYQHYTPTLRTGWYIDEVTVVTGATALPLNTDEGFEGGLGAWEPERGVWEVGVPTAGPESAHAGENCLATVLDGNYPRYADSRAISPAFVVPSVGESPRLRFWHWFSIYGSSDKGSVELREVGSDAWVQISPDYNNSSGVWTYASLDLRAYAGKSVQIAFHFQDDGTDTGYQHYTPTLRTGWYIDEVTVMTGATALPLNTDEGFEGGLGAWEPERGVWEVGVPTAGPESAHAGENCLATVLDGNYPRYADSRAISPAFVVPSVGESPRLRFWHWFSIYGSSDKGSVELREVGSDAWVQISPDYNNSSGVWTYASLDLRAYAGKSVQIAFHFQDDGTDTGYQHYTPTLSSGWYIDEVMIESDPDTEAPDTTITSGPADGSCVTTANVTFEFTGSDTPAGALAYSYMLDGDTWSSYTLLTSITFNNLSQGPHTFAVKAKDLAENEDSTPAVLSFNVDSIIPVLSDISSSTRDYNATITWNSTEPETTLIEYGETEDYGLSLLLDTTIAGVNSLTIDGLTPNTTYHYRVKSIDGCHEVVSDYLTFTTTDILYPNLLITQIDMPIRVKALEQIDIKWLVRNDGPGSAPESWTDKIFLSTDATLDPLDVMLAELSYSDGLDLETERWRSATVDIPAVPAGTYHIIVQTDADNGITEISENDNSLIQQIDYLQVKQLSAAPDQISAQLTPGEVIIGTIDIINLVSTSLTGITAAVQGNSPNIDIQVSPPSTISGQTVQKISYSITASDDSVKTASPILIFSNAEGQTASVRFNITVNPGYPNLVSNPGYLETTMVRGDQTLLELEVTNTGAAAVSNLKIVLPSTDWLSLVTPDSISSLGRGEKITVGLALKPSADLPLGPYTGTLVLAADNANEDVSFRFTAVSDRIGGLKIIAKDEFTYFAEDHPPLAGAAVKISNPYDGSVIVEGITDAEGLFANNDLPEGLYSVEVSAEKHSTYNAIVQIYPERVRELTAFLSRQLVTYTWKVVPVQTEDRYAVTLEAVFETHVPAPVITVEPTVLDLRNVAFDENGSATVNYTITNHGLIAAYGATINFGTHPDYQVTPLTESIGELPAMTSLNVPVVVTRLNLPAMTILNSSQSLSLSSPSASVNAVSDTGSNVCGIPGSLTYGYVCGKLVQRSVPLAVVTGDCPPSETPTISSGGVFGFSGGSGGVDVVGPSRDVVESGPPIMNIPPPIQQSVPCEPPGSGCNGPDCTTCGGADCVGCEGPACTTCKGADCVGCEGPACTTCKGEDCEGCDSPDCTTCKGSDCEGPCGDCPTYLECATCQNDICILRECGQGPGDGTCDTPCGECTRCSNGRCVPNDTCEGDGTCSQTCGNCSVCRDGQCVRDARCDLNNQDDDSDGVPNGEDSNANDPERCGDINNDGCDDCSKEACNGCAAGGVCEDGNDCTVDECQGDECVSEPTPGLSCDDGDRCTIYDVCGVDGCQGRPISGELARRAEELKQSREALREHREELIQKVVLQAISTIKHAKGVVEGAIDVVNGAKDIITRDIPACTTVIGCILLLNDIRKLNNDFGDLLSNVIATRANVMDMMTDINNARISMVIYRDKFVEEMAIRHELAFCSPDPENTKEIQNLETLIQDADDKINQLDGLMIELQKLEADLGYIISILEEAQGKLKDSERCNTPSSILCKGLEVPFTCYIFETGSDLVCKPDIGCTTDTCLDSGEPVPCFESQPILPECH